MSAIATKTRTFVDRLEGTGTKILDTRKTTPGIRALEKWAVKIGGGENHRFALYDMIMLKIIISILREESKLQLKKPINILKIKVLNLKDHCGGTGIWMR